MAAKAIILWIAGLFLTLFLLGMAACGIMVYKLEYKPTDVVSYISPKGDYQIDFQMLGEPGWPFGPANGRFSLKKQKKTIAKQKFQIHNDGGVIHENNCQVIWHEEYVEVILDGEEQLEEIFHVFYDGRIIREDQQLPLEAETYQIKMPVSEKSSETFCLELAEWEWRSEDGQYCFFCVMDEKQESGILYRSEDAGVSFQECEYPTYNVLLLDETQGNLFTVPEEIYEEDGTLYLIAENRYHVSAKCRYRSDDMGVTWELEKIWESEEMQTQEYGG